MSDEAKRAAFETDVWSRYPDDPTQLDRIPTGAYHAWDIECEWKMFGKGFDAGAASVQFLDDQGAPVSFENMQANIEEQRKRAEKAGAELAALQERVRAHNDRCTIHKDRYGQDYNEWRIDMEGL